MSDTVYVLSQQSDFSGSHLCNSDRFSYEIRSSSIASALDYITTTGDAVDVYFKEPLSSQDFYTFSCLAVSHSGMPMPSPVEPVTLYSGSAPIPSAKDGRPIYKFSITNRTTNYKLRAISFYTAQSGSVHNLDPNGNDYGDVTMKMYDVTGSLVTTGSLAAKTVIDFEPTYSYEILSGFIDVPSVLAGGTTDQWFLTAVAVPDYPPAYGGSIDYVSQVNLEAIAANFNRLVADGRAVSFMANQAASGAPHTNKLRFIFYHPLGAVARFQIYVEHFV